MPAKKTEALDKDEKKKAEDARTEPKELSRDQLEALRRKLQAKFH